MIIALFPDSFLFFVILFPFLIFVFGSKIQNDQKR